MSTLVVKNFHLKEVSSRAKQAIIDAQTSRHYSLKGVNLQEVITAEGNGAIWSGTLSEFFVEVMGVSLPDSPPAKARKRQPQNHINSRIFEHEGRLLMSLGPPIHKTALISKGGDMHQASFHGLLRLVAEVLLSPSANIRKELAGINPVYTKNPGQPDIFITGRFYVGEVGALVLRVTYGDNRQALVCTQAPGVPSPTVLMALKGFINNHMPGSTVLQPKEASEEAEASPNGKETKKTRKPKARKTVQPAEETQTPKADESTNGAETPEADAPEGANQSTEADAPETEAEAPAAEDQPEAEPPNEEPEEKEPEPVVETKAKPKQAEKSGSPLDAIRNRRKKK